MNQLSPQAAVRPHMLPSAWNMRPGTAGHRPLSNIRLLERDRGPRWGRRRGWRRGWRKEAVAAVDVAAVSTAVVAKVDVVSSVVVAAAVVVVVVVVFAGGGGGGLTTTAADERMIVAASKRRFFT